MNKMSYLKIAMVVVPFFYVRSRLNSIESSIKDLKKNLKGANLLSKAENLVTGIMNKGNHSK